MKKKILPTTTNEQKQVNIPESPPLNTAGLAIECTSNLPTLLLSCWIIEALNTFSQFSRNQNKLTKNNSLVRRDTFLKHGRTFVSIDAKMVFGLFLFQDNVDVSRYNLLDLFRFGRLDRIVLGVVIAKVQSESVWRCSPSIKKK